jgi:DNA mismatch endonuclease (patch repair protein)
MPKTNIEYWQTKFADNLERDRRKARALRELGYRVVVVWECQTRKPNALTKLITQLKDLLG